MNRFAAAAAFATGALVSTSAFALAQRTFVSTTGSDAAACSLVAPCRSFAAALAQTATGGEVIVLDSGGYGAVSISKDVSIIAPRGVYAGITVSATSPNATGFTVFDARVILRGLSINGQGGDTGIHAFGDAVVQIEDCAISSLDQYGVRIGGLLGSPEVFIHTTMIHDIAGHGIYATGAARVHVDRTSVKRNRGDGLHALNGPTVVVTSSEFAANSGNGALAQSDNGVSTTRLTVSDSTAARNIGGGIIAGALSDGNAVYLRVARSTIASNSQGVTAANSLAGGEAFATVSDNLVTDNANHGVGVGGPGSRLTASNNAVSGSKNGFLAALALFRSLGNNSVRDNVTDTSFVTVVSGN
jgi:hypothetical protein